MLRKTTRKIIMRKNVCAPLLLKIPVGGSAVKIDTRPDAR
jgi:hypothetical protein